MKRLNDGIKASVAVGDNGSRELLEKILLDEEHHIDWLEGQLHMIKEMTYENYLAQQLRRRRRKIVVESQREKAASLSARRLKNREICLLLESTEPHRTAPERWPSG